VRTRVLLTMFNLGLLASPLLAQAEAKRPTAQQEKEIRSVYQQLLTADAQRDTATLKRILAPGYSFVPPRGDTFFTREERLANAASDTSTTRPRYTLVGPRCTGQLPLPIAGTRLFFDLRVRRTTPLGKPFQLLCSPRRASSGSSWRPTHRWCAQRPQTLQLHAEGHQVTLYQNERWPVI
jgi:hypothetical protein